MPEASRMLRPLPVRVGEVYSWRSPEGVVTHFHISRLCEWINRSYLRFEVYTVLFTPELKKFVLESGGLEPEHLKRIPFDRMFDPCLIAQFEDDSHLLIDGVHRAAKHIEMGMPGFSGIFLPPNAWRPFLIPDEVIKASGYTSPV